MTLKTKRQIRTKKLVKKIDSIINTDRIVTDITKKDIKKSYNIKDIQGTEINYSHRYGWTLRRTID